MIRGLSCIRASLRIKIGRMEEKSGKPLVIMLRDIFSLFIFFQMY